MKYQIISIIAITCFASSSIFSQDMLRIEEVISIDITANENDVNIHGYKYVIEKNENNEFEISQVRSYFLPISKGNSFELFLQLDKYFKSDKKDFFERLITDEFDAQIYEANISKEQVKSFYANRIGKDNPKYNTVEKGLLGQISKDELLNLITQINQSKSSKSLDDLMRNLEINEDLIPKMDSEVLLQRVKKKCHATCLEKALDMKILKLSTSMLVENKMFETGLGGYQIIVDIHLSNGENLSIISNGDKDFLIPMNVNNKFDTYYPQLSKALSAILPDNSEIVKDRLGGANFNHRVLENAIRISCSDCKK